MATQKSGKTNYQGKNLLYVLAAICLPAGLLYLRLVLGLAASDSRVGPEQSSKLARASTLALISFFALQVICAFYLQSLAPRPQSRLATTAQFVAVLAVCILFSLTGAIVLEAFGFNVFLRAGFK